jgi:beta-lactamase superfamily II metal-dependent hydrolase
MLKLIGKDTANKELSKVMLIIKRYNRQNDRLTLHIVCYEVQKVIASIVLCFTSISFTPQAQIPHKGEVLSPWKEGYLDLHHINIGRGNVAYYILPDGTTMLFDAGEQEPTDPRTLSRRNSGIRPNDSKRAYEWIAHYINQVAPQGRKAVINYAILSHYHDDHMGAWYEQAPSLRKQNTG